MDRLTKTSDKGGLAFTFDLDITCDKSEIEKIVKLGEKLKSYEDAEEQGLLHKTPVSDGTTIFRLSYIDLFDETMKVSRDCYLHGYTENVIGEMGKDWFLTREAAEEALKGGSL